MNLEDKMRWKIFLCLFFIIWVFFSDFTYGAIPPEERAALIALYYSTDGDNWTNNNGWKTPPLHTDGFAMIGTEGEWYGITVSSNHVTGIILWVNNLNGSIPSKLGNLSNLDSLFLSTNKLSGSIPKELGNLSNLRYLGLYFNQLSGSIPEELGNLKNLWNLELWSNQLTGSIPPELGNLNNLTHLYLYSNFLTGSIPAEIGNLSQLQCLYIDSNKLSSVIPPELGNLNNLLIFGVNDNHLSGNIPSELGNLKNLILLRLDNNKLSGEIPKSLTNLSNLNSDSDYVDFGFNCLYTTDTEVRAWLNNVDPDWETHQDECGFTLTVRSSPYAGVSINVTPTDSYGQGNGNTEFFRTYDIDSIVTLTAPASHNGKNFIKWVIDDKYNENRTVQVTMDRDQTATAVYQSDTYTLTVQSSPNTGVGITVSPNDNNGNGSGNTNFSRIYNSGTPVTLTSPSEDSGKYFIKWTVDGNDYTERTIQVTMGSNHTAVVYYAPPPEISVNRTSLNFGYIIGSNNLPIESFTITNIGGGTLNWTASCEVKYVSLNPGSGANTGVVNVSIDPVGLIPGKFRGVIYVSDSLASNSPVGVQINLWVKKQSELSPPFGEFSTPIDNSIVDSSIPVTGWVLGDTGIESVKIYREEGKNLVFIGDAVFVEGARPDVEAAYLDYPMNYKAGWGYMMLTNFLPNSGNGTFNIHAIATDAEGHQVTLGSKTIHCDNANAVKPFGAIDTPTRGGTASGRNFVNWGWVLTPKPNYIPTNGSTINVYVDGVNLGHPTYNIYRKDIANFFPGYANTNGAAGYFILDTTTYANGVHTIQWTAKDNAGNTDGIGSRYFTIQNSGGASGQQTLVTGHWSLENKEISEIPVSYLEPIRVKRAYNRNFEPQEIYPDDSGVLNIKTRELERVEIHLDRTAWRMAHSAERSVKAKMEGGPVNQSWIGFQVIGDQLRALPVGSTLDIERGIFYWQPGVGFFGDYEFVFVNMEEINKEKVKMRVKILPKFRIKNLKDGH